MREMVTSGMSGLAFYAEVGLLLFFFAFLAVLTQLRFRATSAREWDEQSRLPLHDAEDDISAEGASREIGGRT